MVHQIHNTQYLTWGILSLPVPSAGTFPTIFFFTSSQGSSLPTLPSGFPPSKDMLNQSKQGHEEHTASEVWATIPLSRSEMTQAAGPSAPRD